MNKATLLFLLLSCALLAQTAPEPGPARFTLQETVLGVMPAPVRGKLQVSTNNRHVFNHVQLSKTSPDGASGEWALYRDGVLVGRYSGTLPQVDGRGDLPPPGVRFQFSTDGEHYAFIAERNGKQFVVHDGKESPAYDAPTGFQLSPAGDRIAYMIGRPGEVRLVIRDQVGPPFYSVSGQFSPDGRQFVSIASTGTVSRIFLDGVPLTEEIAERDPQHGYMSIANVKFSSDSRHFVFVASSKRDTRVVLDGKEVGTYQGSIEGLTFSPDNRHLAYQVRPLPGRTDPWLLVVDGVETALRGAIDVLPFAAWSADSQHFAYAVRRVNKALYPAQLPRDGIWPCPDACWFMVLDGVESPGYFDMDAGNARFLADGRLAYSASDGNEWITLIGNERIRGVRIAAITPDGVHRAFALGSSYNPFVVNGKPYAEPASWCCFPKFSGPAAKHLVYGTSYPTNEAFTVVDGIRQPVPCSVWFTPNEDHSVCMYGDTVLVDGVSILKPGDSKPSFSFDGNEGFHAFVIRGNQIVRIDGKF